MDVIYVIVLFTHATSRRCVFGWYANEWQAVAAVTNNDAQMFRDGEHVYAIVEAIESGPYPTATSARWFRAQFYDETDSSPQVEEIEPPYVAYSRAGRDSMTAWSMGWA